LVTLEQIKANPILDIFIRKGNEYIGILGYTEHDYRHLNLVSNIAHDVLIELGYPQRDAELAAIAGYLHDIGNVVSRNEHGLSGANLCFPVLINMGIQPEEVAVIISAIANHEESHGQPVSEVAAVLILADKADVHRSRVRNPELATFDIHDRVNYAVENASLRVDKARRAIMLELSIDTNICPIMEYFEIFLTRMMLCRRAANMLNCNFEIYINGSKLL